MLSTNISRRKFLGTAAALSAASLGWPHAITKARAATKNELVFVGHGGSYQEGQRKALFEPFERETGIKVIESSGVDLAKLRTQVRSKTVDWDVAPFPDRLRYTAVRDELLTPLDYKIINAKDILPQLVTPYAVGCVTFAMMLTYSMTAHPAGKEPKNWADFWDAKKVPGPRGMYNAATYTLEFALLADGVPKNALYPLDVQRAFKSLARVSPDVKVWWSQFPQPGVLLKSGEITMTPWTRSVQMILAGEPLGITFNDAAVTYDAYGVPKGAPHAENAMKFINWALDAKRQADVTNHTAFGPTNPKAFQYIDAKLRPLLPASPANVDKVFILSGDWWGPNLDKVNEQWNEFRLK